MPSAKRMPAAKKRTRSKAPGKPRVSLLHRTKEQLKSATKRKPRRTLNGIPLKRKVVWVYDTESPKFKALWAKERRALKRTPSDPEIDQFLEAAWRDIDRSLDRE